MNGAVAQCMCVLLLRSPNRYLMKGRRNMRSSVRLSTASLPVLIALALLGAGGSAIARAEAPAPAAGASWEGFVDRFIEENFRADPQFAVESGRHEFDGQIADWSAAGIAADVSRLQHARKRALQFTDSRLSARQRFERDYMLASIDKDLFWIDAAKEPFRNPHYYVDRLDPAVYVVREYAPLAHRLQALTRYLESLPRAAQQIRANLRTPLPRTYVDYGVAAFGGFAAYFRDEAPQAFASVSDPQLRKRYLAANAAAIGAMQSLADYLKAGRAAATDDFALGRDLFAQMLRDTERVSTPLVELEAFGRKDLERNLAALREACAQFAPTVQLGGCIAKVIALKSSGDAVADARAQLGELRAFVADKGLVSIPGPEQAVVAQAPPYNRSNFAYINIPGPYERGLSSTFYIAPPDPAWSAAEQASYVPGRMYLLFVSVHEVWPGHFLQFLHSNRSNWLFGRLYVGYAFAEGWAHYSEEMMWEAGLHSGDAETHIGQLQQAVLRDVRFLSAIGLHTGGMTVEQSQRMFLEQAHADPGTARQQAARGTYDPAYLNYTLGKLMIRKLRSDWTGTRGGREAWRAFHDQFLSYGGPPIPLVRAQMLPGDHGALF